MSTSSGRSPRRNSSPEFSDSPSDSYVERSRTTRLPSSTRRLEAFVGKLLVLMLHNHNLKAHLSSPTSSHKQIPARWQLHFSFLTTGTS
eukprot:6320977-Pyramimonas_sp.AAC.1